jgi:hypothetical protein
MENSLADVERNIIEKELNNHSINASVVPPSVFSNIPVITSPHRDYWKFKKYFLKQGDFLGKLIKKVTYL